MLDAWAKAYADRWGLPQPAVAEILRVMDAVSRGDVALREPDKRCELFPRFRGAASGDLSPSVHIFRGFQRLLMLKKLSSGRGTRQATPCGTSVDGAKGTRHNIVSSIA